MPSRAGQGQAENGGIVLATVSWAPSAQSGVTRQGVVFTSCHLLLWRYTHSHVSSVLTGQDRRDDNHLRMPVLLRTGPPCSDVRPHRRCWANSRYFALQFGCALHRKDQPCKRKGGGEGRVDKTNHLLSSEADSADGRALARKLSISKSFAFAVDRARIENNGFRV